MKENKLSILLSNSVSKIFGSRIDFSLRYYHHRHHFPKLKQPEDMSEILISQILSKDFCAGIAKYVDKIEVRNYVKNKGLDHILLKHYGVWNTPEDVPFEDLPNKFALKSNNGCAHHVICHDKTKLNYDEARKTLHEAIENGLHNVEQHYHYITPKVYAEELIETPDGGLPVDYKFTCVGGEIMDIFVATDRATSTHYCTLDLNWEPLPYTKPEYLPKEIPAKPKHLKEMIEVARKLSEDFGFVRVDLYEYRDQPFISELTFFPWGAMLYSYTDEAIKLYGDKWHAAMKAKANK